LHIPHTTAVTTAFEGTAGGWNAHRIPMFVQRSPFNRARVQIAVETNMKLGELAALCKLDADGNPTKVVKCSSACIIDYGEETAALKVLKSFLVKTQS
jgi:hypothetical protein